MPVSISSSSAHPAVRWLFLDLNSYFASVEQELRPELRGKPVAVVPVTADTGTCIAASYEAKAFGVKTGVKVGEAKRLCPGLELVVARHREYVEYHHRIIEAVERCLPVSAVLSIDEMACSLMGREQQLLNALALARQVKESVRTHAGTTLRCSIGLAPNRYLAKIASDMEKPDGLVALTPDILQAALAGLQLRDLPGVGAQMERRLHAAGIRSMPQLLALGREGMRTVWNGAGGEKLWYWLQGEDFNDPALEHQKSISQSHVLAPEMRTPDGAWAVLHKLLHKAAMRLRTANLWTTHLTLSIKFAVPKAEMQRRHSSGLPQAVWSQGTSVVECQDTQTLIEALAKLWAKRPHGTQHQTPFYVGVWLGNLVPDNLHTLSLFSGLDSGLDIGPGVGATFSSRGPGIAAPARNSEARRTRLASAMDKVNHKYGIDTLAPASMLLAKASAHTRIAFTNIPDLFEPDSL